jgi:hypothetical protein
MKDSMMTSRYIYSTKFKKMMELLLIYPVKLKHYSTNTIRISRKKRRKESKKKEENKKKNLKSMKMEDLSMKVILDLIKIWKLKQSSPF